MMKENLALAFSLFYFLIFVACSGSKPVSKLDNPTEEVHGVSDHNPIGIRDEVSISFDDFQPLGCEVDRPSPNTVQFKIGKQPCTLMLSSDQLVNLTSGYWLSFMRECDRKTALGISLLFWSKNNTGRQPDLTIAEGIFPGLPSRRAIPMTLLKEGRGTPKTPGSLISFAFGAGLQLDEWSRFAISITDFYGDGERLVTLSDFQFVKDEPDYPVGQQIIIDEIGQWEQASFVDKFDKTSDMIDYLRSEAAIDVPDRETDQLSHYGGCKEKRFDASGYFRTQQEASRWFLVDPQGYAFYSIGIDIIGPGIGGNVEGIKSLYTWLPSEDDQAYEEAWTKADYLQDIRSESGFSSQNLFDFGTANLIKTFGKKWHDKWSAITSRRLIEWDVNTIGNWSDSLFAKKSKTPYVMSMESFPITKKRIFRDFPDVFSPEFKSNADAFAQQLRSYKHDPYLVGYFMNNEPGWAYVSDLNIAEHLLAQGDGYVSKKVLIEFLSDKYQRDILAFNTAWKTSHKSFSDLNKPVRNSATLSEHSNIDLKEFSTRMLEEYIHIPAEAAKKVDANHLNLGMRWASSALKQKWRFAGSQFLDVFSINNYSDDPTQRLDIASDMSGDMPILIGEFHHGSMEAGHPTFGARWTKTEAERAVAYRYYAERAAHHPNSIGIHYFAFHDDPVLGRFDGENFHHGFVTTAHKPYTDFISGYSKANQGLYDVVLRKREPVKKYADGMVQFIPLSF